MSRHEWRRFGGNGLLIGVRRLEISMAAGCNTLVTLAGDFLLALRQGSWYEYVQRTI